MLLAGNCAHGWLNLCSNVYVLLLSTPLGNTICLHCQSLAPTSSFRAAATDCIHASSMHLRNTKASELQGQTSADSLCPAPLGSKLSNFGEFVGSHRWNPLWLQSPARTSLKRQLHLYQAWILSQGPLKMTAQSNSFRSCGLQAHFSSVALTVRQASHASGDQCLKESTMKMCVASWPAPIKIFVLYMLPVMSWPSKTWWKTWCTITWREPLRKIDGTSCVYCKPLWTSPQLSLAFCVL